MRTKLLVAAGLLLAGVTTQSFGAPVTFFAEDVATSGGPAPFTNAETARNNFFTNLTGVGTENFDSFSTTPTTLTFPGAGTATLSGNAQLQTGPDGAGRYPHSGANYLVLDTQSFTVAFNNPGGIAAFGFFSTDVGDFGAHLTLTLTDLNNVTTLLTIPNTTSNNGEISGSNFYFGFFDTGNTYKQIVFNSDSPSLGTDVFGFDDMSVGSLEQVTPGGGATPLPAALPLFASGAGVIGFFGWRRKRKPN
jgi:hypothetical protein